ncbi:dimethyl sulfoxide reductase anchor subunit family protein [Desulfosporosinus youngiae]|uniref:DMSO reductase anchor subunit n=1 Tax=Desulfosporosinus youngiae DSM 17734 TaxID=768710 RepID=H5Y5M7_9FIRM|nr:DmsC/YnfH family molybdoenzyme membrane anchor subunit [Desulfosporosinus youngiae]EHQ90614.1 DMSO reductase anchor subunit [Desulfosporosinus youngiae DSM 17734]
MFAEEWPLMMFTLLSQLAIGTYIMLFLIRLMLAKDNASSASQLTKSGLMLTGPVMAAALVFSLFHLGTPLGAVRSILNLGSSWLSREIITAGGFLVFWLISYQAFRKGKSGKGLGIVTSLIGLAAIFCMASIYSSSIRPAWTSLNTYIAFYGATFALGSAGALTLVSLAAQGKPSEQARKILKTVVLVLGAAIVVPLLYLPVFISGLSSGVPAAQASAQLLSGTYLAPIVIRALLSLAGVVLLFLGLKKQAPLSPNQVLTALVLVLAGEFIGRYVFYGAAVSIFTGHSLI